MPFAGQADWEAWLEAHHDTSDGVWMRIAKKGSGITSIDYPGAVESALCFGWIDGQRKGLDDSWFVQRFTPRRARSKWSKVNIGHVERLTAEGRMRAAGLGEVERAKADGRWAAAYDPASRIQVPDDLRAALDARPEAAAFFETLTGSARFAFLFRVHDAKRPDTRARRIAQYVDLLANQQTL